MERKGTRRESERGRKATVRAKKVRKKIETGGMGNLNTEYKMMMKCEFVSTNIEGI